MERVLTIKDHSSNCLGEHLLSDSGCTMREFQRPYILPSFARQPSFIDTRSLRDQSLNFQPKLTIPISYMGCFLFSFCLFTHTYRPQTS